MNFIRIKEVLNRVSLSKSTMYSEISAGRFPKPVVLSPRSVAWIESEVESWMKSKVAQSRGGIYGGIYKTSNAYTHNHQ